MFYTFILILNFTFIYEKTNSFFSNMTQNFKSNANMTSFWNFYFLYSPQSSSYSQKCHFSFWKMIFFLFSIILIFSHYLKYFIYINTPTIINNQFEALNAHKNRNIHTNQFQALNRQFSLYNFKIIWVNSV